MANMFTNTARMFKFDVLVAYAKQAFEEGKIDEAKINAYAHDLVSLDSPRLRILPWKCWSALKLTRAPLI